MDGKYAVNILTDNHTLLAHHDVYITIAAIHIDLFCCRDVACSRQIDVIEYDSKVGVAVSLVLLVICKGATATSSFRVAYTINIDVIAVLTTITAMISTTAVIDVCLREATCGGKSITELLSIVECDELSLTKASLSED